MKVRHKVRRLITVAVLGSCLSWLTTTQPAFAKPTDPFTPMLDTCTAASPCTGPYGTDPDTGEATVVTYAGTTQAGAHPDLTTYIHKDRNRCLTFTDPPFDQNCLTDQAYLEQDLKKVVLHLPPGLVADANAAPYCDPYKDWYPPDDPSSQQYVWLCSNPESVVGSIYLVLAGCGYVNGKTDRYNCPAIDPNFPGAALASTGVVYNAAPGPGEQGHLIVLWPGYPAFPWFFGNYMRADISIKVRDSDTGIDAVANGTEESPNGIPDLTTVEVRSDGKQPTISVAGAQVSDMVMTLFGSKGLDKGHPLLTNPTFCEPQLIDAEFQGYETSSYETAQYVLNPDTGFYEYRFQNGSGDGKTATDSAPYQATGCDSIPYDPRLSLSLDNSGPDQPPAITSTVSQAQGEATTKKVTVSFPKAFKINDRNKSTFCSDADLGAKTCPDSSKVGTVTADSPLLPIGQSLTGGVYLAGLSGDSIKISALLTGFIDLRIDASAKIAVDGSLVTTFDDLPAVPIGQFKLNLEGGDKGLIKTPKVCAPQSVTSTFQSHSGKTATVVAPVDITGCGDPTLDATLSSRRPGAPTDLDLDLHSKGTKISNVTFGLARHLHWGRRAASAAKRAKTPSAGTATFTTSTGEVVTRFVAKRTRQGNVGLAAIGPRTAKGTLGASAVPSFAGSLFRTNARLRQTRKISRKTRAARPPAAQSDLLLGGIPEDDLTGIDLNFNGTGRGLSLRSPIGCKKALNFVAFVTTADGRHLALKDQVRLKGKGC